MEISAVFYNHEKLPDISLSVTAEIRDGITKEIVATFIDVSASDGCYSIEVDIVEGRQYDIAFFADGYKAIHSKIGTHE